VLKTTDFGLSVPQAGRGVYGRGGQLVLCGTGGATQALRAAVVNFGRKILLGLQRKVLRRWRLCF
jgi:hypothetical protein